MSLGNIINLISAHANQLKEALIKNGVLDANGNLTEQALSQDQLVQVVQLVQGIDIKQLEQTWDILAAQSIPAVVQPNKQNAFAAFYSQSGPHPTDNTEFNPTEPTIEVITKAYSLHYQQTVHQQHGAARNQSCLAATEAFKKQRKHHPEKLQASMLNKLIEARAFLQMLAIPVQEIRAYQLPDAVNEDVGEKLKSRAHEVYLCLNKLLKGAQKLGGLKQSEQIISAYSADNAPLTTSKENAAAALSKSLSPIIIEGLFMLDDNYAYDHFNPAYLDAEIDPKVHEKLLQFSKRLFANQQQLFSLDQSAKTFLPLVLTNKWAHLSEEEQGKLIQQQKKQNLYQYLLDNPNIGSAAFLAKLAERKAILEQYCQYMNSQEVKNSLYYKYLNKKMVSPFDSRNMTNLQRYEAELKMINKLIPAMMDKYPAAIVVSVQMMELSQLFANLANTAEWDNDKVQELMAEISGYEQQLAALTLQQRETTDSQSLTELCDQAVDLRNAVEKRIKNLQAELAKVTAIIDNLNNFQHAANFKAIEPVLNQYKQHIQQLQGQQPTANWNNWEKVVNQIVRISSRLEAIRTLATETNNLKYIAIGLEKGDEKLLAAWESAAELINPILRRYLEANLSIWQDKPGAAYAKSFNAAILRVDFTERDFEKLLTDASVRLDKEQQAAFHKANHIIRECAAKAFALPAARENWLQQAFAKANIILTAKEIASLANNESLQQLGQLKPEPAKKNDALAIFAHGTWQGEEVRDRFKKRAKPRMLYSNIINQFAAHCRTPHLILEGPDLLGLEVFKNLDIAEKFIVEQARSNPELKKIAFTGFSRGGAMGKRLAHRFYSEAFKKKYPDIAARNLEFDIFAIDPVAGTADKRDADTIEITPNVRNYVATYQLDEPRFIMKPQGPSRTRVVDPSKTALTFLRLPGVHGDGTVISKGKQTQHVPILTWHLLHNFMTGMGVEFKGDRVPPLSIYDKKQKQAGHLSVSERFLLEEYKYTGDQEQDQQIDRKLLEIYQDLKLNRQNYQCGSKVQRSGNDHIDDFVFGADFFMNQHERELFKRVFPTVFNYFFEKHQPEPPARPEHYELAAVRQELQDNLQHPAMAQLAKQYAKHKSELDPKIDTQYIEMKINDKTSYYLPGGSYRLEQCKLTEQKPVGDNLLDYLEKKTLDAMMGYCRNRNEISKSRYHQQAKEIRADVRGIMKENISEASKAFKVISLLEGNLQKLKPGTRQDKLFSTAIKQVLDDPVISHYKQSIDNSVECYFDKIQIVLSCAELLNESIEKTIAALMQPAPEGISLQGLIQLAKASNLSASAPNISNAVKYFDDLIQDLNQSLMDTKAELAKYEQIKQGFRYLNSGDNAEKLAAMNDWHIKTIQRYQQQLQKFDALTNDLAELHRERRQRSAYHHAELARKIEQLKPNQSLLVKENQFVVKRARIIGGSGKGAGSKAAFKELLKVVKADLAEGYLSWQLLDKAATSTWGKKVLTNIPELVPEYQALNSLLVREIAQALNYRSKELFMRIPNEELLRPGKYGKREICPNLAAYTEHFNQVAEQVKAGVIAETNIDTRTVVMERWIWVMDACLHAGNFHAARAINSALRSSELERLKATKVGLSPAAKERFAQLNELFSTDGNSKKLRQEMLEGNRANVPFLGLMLTDMTFAHDGNPTADFAALASVTKNLSYIDNIRENAKHFNPQRSRIAAAMTDAISVYDSNSVTEGLRFAQSLALEPRNQQTAASEFIHRFLDPKLLAVPVAVNEPAELAVTAEAQASVWHKQHDAIANAQLSALQVETMADKVREQLKHLTASITNLTNIQLGQLKQDAGLLLKGAGDNSKLHYIDKFLRDSRWKQVEQDIVRYQAAVAHITLLLDGLKAQTNEATFKQYFNSEAVQYEALAFILEGSKRQLIESNDDLQQAKANIIQTAKTKAEEHRIQANHNLLSAEHINGFENRYLRQLLHENKLVVTKAIAQAQILLFNISHKDITTALLKLGIEGVTAKHLSNINLAQQELGWVRQLKNKSLQQLLIFGAGSAILGLTPTYIDRLNQFSDEQTELVMRELGIAITIEQARSIADENLRIRAAHLFNASVFISALDKHPNLAIHTVNGEITTKVQEAIKSINQLMVAKKFDRAQLENLLHAVGLGVSWLNEKVTSQDISRVAKSTQKTETWWDLIVAEHLRMRKADRLVHPILRQLFLENARFDFKEEQSLSLINTFSTKEGRGVINERLNNLITGWALTETEYHQLQDFNQIVARLIRYHLLNEHKSTIVQYKNQLGANMADIYPLEEPISIAGQLAVHDMSKYYVDITISDLLVNLEKIKEQQRLLTEQKLAISELYRSAYDRLTTEEQVALNNIANADIPLSDIDDYRDNTILQAALLNKHINEQLEKVNDYHEDSIKLLQALTLRQLDSFSVYLQTLKLEYSELLSAINRDNTIPDTQIAELKRCLNRIEYKLWQLPIDEVAVIHQQFTFLSANEAQDIVQLRQQLLQMQSEVKQVLADIYRQQQEQQHQQLAIAHANSAARIQLVPTSTLQNTKKPVAQSVDITKPIVNAGYDRDNQTASLGKDFDNSIKNSVWSKQERINEDLTRHIHRNGLSIVDSKKGTSFYERPVSSIMVDETLHAKEREMCKAWADMLMPQIVKQPITIGGYDQTLRSIMAEEFNKRGIEVAFENELENPGAKPEEVSKTRSNFFGADRK